jgi:hypothetical protein
VDRAALNTDGISFVLSRLPDQDKLDSILEHQAELEKEDLAQQVGRFSKHFLNVCSTYMQMFV